MYTEFDVDDVWAASPHAGVQTVSEEPYYPVRDRSPAPKAPPAKRPAGSAFSRVVGLLREAENRLIKNAGQTNPVDRVSTLRGIYYGTVWSLDYKVESKRSEPGARIRNIGFMTYTGGNMPPDPRPALGTKLFEDLQANQSVIDGRFSIDIGHVLIGMETRASLALRTVPMPGQGGTALEIVTWLGDLGGGAASLARRRINAPSTSVSTIFNNNSSDYGVMDNLEGDAGGYLVASASTPGGAPASGSGTAIADALATYLPIKTDTEWRTRAARFAQALGATIGGGGIANKSEMVDRLTKKMYDFAVWYAVTRWIPSGELKGNNALTACSHMDGAAREVATVFVDTLDRATAGKGPVQASAPYPRPSAKGTCRSLLLRGAAFNPGMVRSKVATWSREFSTATEAVELQVAELESTLTATLQSARFAGDPTLEAVLGGTLRLGAPGTSPYPAPVLSSGPSIAKIQQALIDLHYPMPQHGADAKFGSETGTAVVKFKTIRGIQPNDPVVGPKTMAALDEAIVALDRAQPTPPDPRPKPPDPRPKPPDPQPEPLPVQRNWFTGDVSTGMSPVLRNSAVTFLVDAEEYYADLRREVTDASEQQNNGFVCWAGFDARGATLMPAAPPKTVPKPFAPRSWREGDRAWLDVLGSATTRGVQLRALLNLTPSPEGAAYRNGCFDTVAQLNQLKNTLAINDFRYLYVNGTHHQKLVIVHNDAGLTAYVGTMDVHQDRIYQRWCEVQCKVRGEAARELYRVFYVRWQEHTAMLAGQPRERAWLPRPEDVRLSAGGSAVTQHSTTYGSPRRGNPFIFPGNPSQQVVNLPHRVVIGSTPIMGNDFFKGTDPAAPPLIAAARKQSPGYAFAPNGHTGIYHQIKAVLEHRPRFIYMEDQYLIEDLPMDRLPSMLALLEQRVRDPLFQKLIIFCTRIHEINKEMKYLAETHRRAFVARLAKAGGDKVVVCQYKSNAALGLGDNWKRDPQNSPFYIHSKTWIFDDELAIIGSANCNRRGYSHDSELDFGVYQPGTSAVRDLRAKLWLRRLNTEMVKKPLTPADVMDFAAAARYWERPAEHGLTIENHRMGINAFVPLSVGPGMAVAGPYAPLLAALGGSVPGAAVRLFWDFVIDPEGTCAKCPSSTTSREAEVGMLAGVSR